MRYLVDVDITQMPAVLRQSKHDLTIDILVQTMKIRCRHGGITGDTKDGTSDGSDFMSCSQTG